MAEIEIADGITGIPAAEWNALAADESPFLEWEWLASLEESGAVCPDSGWQPRPLLVREGGTLVAACPLYVKGHSEGEFVFDWGWADAALRAGIDYYPKLLVAVPFTPVAGTRFLTGPGQERNLRLAQLAAALRTLCDDNDLSGVHVNFCREDERKALEGVGFLPRLGFQYHWRNEGYRDFEDYLAGLRSKRRNQVRRERRSLEEQNIRLETYVGDAIPDDLFPIMFQVYRSTVDKNPWGRPYLNAHLFELLEQRYRHRLCFVVARQGGEVVAGTVNVQKGKAFYGRYWGCFRELRHLHFNVCYYAGIEHCIRSGMERFEPGAGGEYKQLRGFDAQPTWSCHYLRDERLRDAVERFLDVERDEAREAIDWLQDRTARRRGT